MMSYGASLCNYSELMSTYATILTDRFVCNVKCTFHPSSKYIIRNYIQFPGFITIICRIYCTFYGRGLGSQCYLTCLHALCNVASFNV